MRRPSTHMSQSPYQLYEPDAPPAGGRVALLLTGTACALAGFALGAIATTVASSSPTLVAKVASEEPPPPGVLARCEHGVRIKSTVCSMDHALVSMTGNSWKNYSLFDSRMAAFWSDDFRYIPMYGIDESVGLQMWFDNEMRSWSDAFPWVDFNQMIFVGSGPNASTTTYAVGDWEQALIHA